MTFIPISALLGDNVVERSRGDALVPGPAAALPPRARPHRLRPQPDRRALPGAVGDPPAVDQRRRLPRLRRPGRRRRASGRATRWSCCRAASASTVAGIDTFDGPVEEAFPPMSVALRLADDIDVGRGQHDRAHAEPADGLQQLRVPAVLDVRAAAEPAPALSGQAHDAHGDARRGRRPLPDRRRDPAPRRERHARWSSTTSRACTCELSSPLVFDSYRRNRVTGSLIVIDEATNETVAAGVILDTEVEGADRSRRASAARTCAGRARA